MIENPIYGGAYAYGMGYTANGVGRKIHRKARADWIALKSNATRAM
jgi:hypothetical protein